MTPPPLRSRPLRRSVRFHLATLLALALLALAPAGAAAAAAPSASNSGLHDRWELTLPNGAAGWLALKQ